MKIKRYFAKDMKTALAEVKEELGAEAVIMSNKKVTGGIEIVAAVDSADIDPATPQPAAEPISLDFGQPQSSPTSRSLAEDSVSLSSKGRAPQQQSKNVMRPAAAPNRNRASAFSDMLNHFEPASASQPATAEKRTRPTYETRDEEHERLRQERQKLGARAKKAYPRAGESQEFADNLSPLGREALNWASNQAASKRSAKRDAYQDNHRTSNTRRDEQYSKAEQIRQELERSARRQAPAREPLRPQKKSCAPPRDAELENMRNEMASIRELLEHQLSGLMRQEVERKEPLRAMLIERLEKMGFSTDVADQLAYYIPENTAAKEAWSTVLSILADQVLTVGKQKTESGGIIALLGPTGVGKTTTIAKLAARVAMEYGPDEVALVTTDTFRIGAHEQLATYGRIMGCPVKIAKNADELSDVLHQFRHRRFVLVDTAGMGQRDIRLQEQLDTLIENSGEHIQSYLVLPATAQRRVLQETIDQFKRIPLSGCVLSKLDESLSLGELISVTIQNALPIAYLADGQRVPEDLRLASGQYLVEKADDLLQQELEHSPHFLSTEPSDIRANDFYD